MTTDPTGPGEPLSPAGGGVVSEHTDDRGILPDEVPIGATLTLTCPNGEHTFEWTSEPGYQMPRTYCSKKCKNRARHLRFRTHRIPLDGEADEMAGDMRLLICTLCEDPFGWISTEGSSVTGPPLYCSIACKERAKRLRKKARDDERDAGRAIRRAEYEAAVAAKQQRVANRESREGRIEEANRLRQELEQRQRQIKNDADRITAMSEAARFLMLPAGRCTTCGKVASPTEDTAKDTKRAIERKSGRTSTVRYYQCPDGWWHWTRMGADLDTWKAERMMTTSPASLRHRGRGGWTVPT